MGCTVRGSKEIQEQLLMAPSIIRANMPTLLQNYANEIHNIARMNHRFTSDNYDLENSISTYVNAQANYMVVYLNNDRTTTKDNFDYGEYIHRGSKDGTTWVADPFIFKAFEKKESALNKAVEAIIWDILTKI